MAERPVFIPQNTSDSLVDRRIFSFTWHPGFAVSQKKKNIAVLHAVAASAGFAPLLEISTKSDDALGNRLSAFNLRVTHAEHGDMPLECAFQGGKRFEHGGPFFDLYLKRPRDAKRDDRLKLHGALVGFEFDGYRFPLEPKTVFYDWLYISALLPHRADVEAACSYAGFTDIEFNPAKSLNCQARACAAMVAMIQRGDLDDAVQSPERFIDYMRAHDVGR